jgi:xylulose-5-phosphate/fructose-6-phosphate phosphoketolase
MPDDAFDALFTTDKPVLFAYHGYPALIHRLTYRRNNHRNFHVRGYNEEGTTTTPFDMVVLNGLDRLHLMRDAVDYAAGDTPRAAEVSSFVRDALLRHRRYIEEHGEDLPEIRNWRWPGTPPAIR